VLADTPQFLSTNIYLHITIPCYITCINKHTFIGSNSHRLNRNRNNRVNRNSDTQFLQANIHAEHNKYKETMIMKSDSERAWERKDWYFLILVEIRGNYDGARNLVTEGWSRGGEESYVRRK